MMRLPVYKYVLKPSVEYLERLDVLMLRTKEMAEFLGVPVKAITSLVGQDRIPLPMKLGIGHCYRWSAFELVEWVQAGCPRRTQWIQMRGRSGWYRQWEW